MCVKVLQLNENYYGTEFNTTITCPSSLDLLHYKKLLPFILSKGIVINLDLVSITTFDSGITDLYGKELHSYIHTLIFFGNPYPTTQEMDLIENLLNEKFRPLYSKNLDNFGIIGYTGFTNFESIFTVTIEIAI